uniref:Uncharacterized protein n=1 Tax=Hemiselmis andersenii TaxID=464988 RepID=A0A6U4MJE7_HEMAN
MQQEHDTEVSKMETQLRGLQGGVAQRDVVIEKLSRKVEEANANGLLSGGSVEDLVPELRQLRAQQGGKESWVVVQGSQAPPPAARAKQEIVWKSAAQPDVFTQVAKQTNRTEADVKKAHDRAVKEGDSGVAAASVASGQRFSFASLRAAVTNRVATVVTKVDQWADSIETSILQATGAEDGAPIGTVVGEGGVVEGTVVGEEERQQARQALNAVGQNSGWSPDRQKLEAGKARIEQFRKKQQEQEMRSREGGQ